MKELKEFTVERLSEIAMDAYEADLANDEMSALAKIALAAKQAKPVGYLFLTPEGAIAHSISNVGIEGFKFIGEVYDAPPLNHTEQDGWIKCSDRMPLKVPQEGAYDDVEVLVSNGLLVEQILCASGNPLTDKGYKPWVSFSEYGAISPEEITHWMPIPAAPKPD